MRDPAAAYVTWNWPTVYGPVWTRLEIVRRPAARGGLWAQVVALKTVEAAALVGAALAGRRIAARLSPGRENLTLLAIGLNPLLLLEGPGSGHNDLLLVCLLLVGAMFYAGKKYAWAALFLGLSVGIKLITLAVLPWAWLEWGRGPFRAAKTDRRSHRGLRSRCFPHRFATSASGMGRRRWPLCRHGHVTLTPHSRPGCRRTGCRAWRWDRGAAVTLSQNRWLSRRSPADPLAGRSSARAWLTAWAILAALLMFFALGLPFPWYICWFWPVCLLRWDKWGMGLSAACFGLSLAWTAGYGISIISNGYMIRCLRSNEFLRYVARTPTDRLRGQRKQYAFFSAKAETLAEG